MMCRNYPDPGDTEINYLGLRVLYAKDAKRDPITKATPSYATPTLSVCLDSITVRGSQLKFSQIMCLCVYAITIKSQGISRSKDPQPRNKTISAF